MAQLNFDPSQYDPNEGSPGFPVSGPEGHLVRIVESGWSPVQNDPEKARFVFKLEMLEAPHNGFKADYGFNLKHPNQQTVEIALRQLSALCYVLGVFSPLTDTQVLHGKPFRICVRQQKRNQEYTEVWKVLDERGRSAIDIKNAGPASMSPPAAAGPPMTAAAAPQPAAPQFTQPAPAPAAPAAPAMAPAMAPAAAPPATPAPAAAPPMAAPAAPAAPAAFPAQPSPAPAPAAAPALADPVAMPASAPVQGPIAAPPPVAPGAPAPGQVPPPWSV